MKDATKYANDIAQKENDDALEGIRKSGKSEVIKLTDAQKAAMEESARRRCTRRTKSRVGKDTIEEVYKQTGFKP